jgi:tetratricopeptide (TPR) repeat protein
VWQELRTELHPRGLEIVTVALDVDPEQARPYIEAAAPSHPSLIDQAHVVDERFGVVNVPNSVWIDEDGMIVRPAEPAHPGRNPEADSFRTIDLNTVPEDVREMLTEARKIQSDPALYLAMLRDWVEHGASSRYALSPDEVVERSGARTDDEARAAAHFELGQHLRRAGDHEAAIGHWREAHRLAPDNWTYKRNAWNFEDPMRQGPTDVYESSWFEDLKKIGAENYYPPLVP